ncbi:Lysophosphatidylcholine acyltransferase 2 [Perkinsus olseni]|uniref:Lysophosphatidylcholine acyltransferase 2 n=1 Tax=Perkinsus olseni TaxID=32597 RepID=A0A7J6MIR2_PEROL|nr:Lysophosphatidylcholine acyltransferase 2 [Perkinsus olseni]KAF4675645.1 Lysophosphatidylcholine acyltransferase 2 [Perkinsus olseni]
MPWIVPFLFGLAYILLTALCIYNVYNGYVDAMKCDTRRITNMLGRVPADWAAFLRPSLDVGLPSLMLLAVTVVPFKLVVVVLFHIAGVVGLYTLPTSIFLPLLSFFCKVFLKFLGITVREKGERLPSIDTPTIVPNHVSYFDILVMLSRSHPVSFVAKKAVAAYPVIGDIATSLGSVYVDRTKDPEERDQTMGIIEKKQRSVMEGRSRYQLCVFAEGTTSNGTCLMHYHDGAFDSMLPVQPVYLEYSDLRLSFTCFDLLPHFFLVMALPPWRTITCTVHWLPKVTPSPGSTVREFSGKARDEVAKAGGLRLDNSSNLKGHYEITDFFYGDAAKVATGKLRQEAALERKSSCNSAETSASD